MTKITSRKTTLPNFNNGPLRKMHKKISFNQKMILMNSFHTRWLLSKSLRDISTMTVREKISLDNIKWNSKPRCAVIGKSLENVSSKTLVHSPMVSMNFRKSLICHRTSRQSPVPNSTKPDFAHMATGANFCIHNLISLPLISSTMLVFLKKTLGSQKKEQIL